ncbi:LPS export ABC transporter permease LptG [Thiomicrospira sp. R3]|uniref:LPS export ABC transporter permease LptG n=1 Tax=Thiomicrospira sp. R3 TaxID=3035472 RepID=UPI00259B921C|nr:LPS export ABC transporter permease LptG [Thiomicrospira sp. R3]WFE67951.1 LPS export ABC transporter permease LptG [Thiomicrospira sp. R3]
MNRIEWYLGRVVISHTLLVLFVLLIIFAFTEFMNQVARIDEGYTLSLAGLYTLLKMPVYGYEVFPIALLIGTLIGLGGLANHAELTVLRVTGWSVARILVAVMKTALVLWLIAAALGEWMAPKSEGYANQLRAEALQRSISLGDRSGFWMKEPERLIHVEQVIASDRMQGVTIYQMQQGQIVGVTQAAQAEFMEDHWRLTDVHHQSITLTAYDQQAAIWPSITRLQNQMASKQEVFPLDPAMLKRLQLDSKYLRIDELHQYIQFLQLNGLESAPFELEFWRKLAAPLVVMGMIALVFPLIFGAQRQVSMGQRIFVGTVIGLGFYLLNQLIGNLSVVYQFPPFLGAFVPSLVLLMVAVVLFRRLR